jgi:hypothetical protein
LLLNKLFIFLQIITSHLRRACADGMIWYRQKPPISAINC